MKRIFAILALSFAVFVVALLFVPRLQDARLTTHSILLRLGVVIGLDAERIEIPSEGAVLSGTIVFPRATPLHGGLVLIHGSGPSTRMLWFANLFASRGFAVLTYDKRGVGESGGQFVGGRAAATPDNLDLLAADAAAAATVLARHARLQGRPVGYAGFSQGGWIGPIAAARAPDVAFMVFFSGPVVTVCEEDHFSNLAERDPTFWETHTRDDVAKYMSRVSGCPPNDVDPRRVLVKLRIPALWTFGGRDNILPIDLSVSRLDALIAAGQSQFSYRVYPDRGHEMIVFDFANLSLSAPFLDAADWMKLVVDGKAPQPN